MNLDVRLIADRDTIDAHATEWDALVQDAPSRFDGLDGTASFAWFDALRESFDVSAPRLLTARQDGKLVGAIPLVELGRSPLGAKLGLPTELYGGRNGPLLADAGGEQVLEVLLKALERQGGRWSSLQMTLPEGPLAARVRTVCSRLGWRWHEDEVPASAGFPIPPAGTPLKDVLTSNVWQNLRKSQNRAQKRGQPIQVREYHDERDAQALLQLILQIERKSWKHEAGTAITNHPQQQAFYAALFARAMRTRLFKAWVLFVGDEPAAHHFGLQDGGVFCCLKHSHAQTFDDFSPSNLLMAEMLPQLAESGALSFDWMGLVEPHKLRWSSQNVHYTRRRFRLYRPGLAGLAHAAFAAWRARRTRPPEDTASLPTESGSSLMPDASSGGSLTTRVLRPGAELDALAPKWEALIQDRPDDLLSQDATAGPCWHAALAASREEAAAMRTLVLSHRAAVHAVLPVVEQRRGRLGTQLALAAEVHGGRSGPVIRDDRAETAAALLQELPRLDPKWVSLQCTVVKGSPVARALGDACTRLGLRCVEIVAQEAAFVRLLGSAEEFQAGVSHSLMRNLRQSLRLAGERGHVQWKEFTEPSQAEELMATMLEVERHSWKHEVGSSVDQNPHQEAFYRALAPRAMAEQKLLALVMYLDETPITYQLGLRQGDVYLCLKNSMRSDARDLRPGFLLKVELFNRLRAQGIKAVDLMGVIEPHKLVWADPTPRYERSTLVIYRNNLAGRVLRGARIARARVAQLLHPTPNAATP